MCSNNTNDDFRRKNEQAMMNVNNDVSMQSARNNTSNDSIIVPNALFGIIDIQTAVTLNDTNEKTKITQCFSWSSKEFIGGTNYNAELCGTRWLSRSRGHNYCLSQVTFTMFTK